MIDLIWKCCLINNVLVRRMNNVLVRRMNKRNTFIDRYKHSYIHVYIFI
jgi:hypothetical protein